MSRAVVPDTGTQLYLMLPLSYDTPPLAILVVDDEPGVLQVVEAVLHDDGHWVMTAGTGEDALRLFREKKWDLVLTDRAMPGMSGLDLAGAIKELSPRMPVVMVTGTPPCEGSPIIDAVVPKPFTRATLKGGISEAFAACARRGDASEEDFSAAA